MFLLVFVQHVGAHPDGHQHDVSIQISINLGKTFLRISRYGRFFWPESWRGSLYIYLLSFSRFRTLSIERFWFLFWSILNGVTLKTSNSCCLSKRPTNLCGYISYPLFLLLENMVIYGLQVASEITQFSSETSARNYLVILKRSQKTF